MSTTSQELWTTLKLLEWTTDFFNKRGIDSARLDAQLLLSHVLGISRIMLYAEFERPLTPEELDTFRALVKRRSRREPIAYLTGSRGFWEIELKTDARALIPRPDTETLVERALKLLPKDEAARVIDVGTGTGAIALALAHARPGVEVLATDRSAEALALAAENVATLHLSERVTLREADVLDGVDWQGVDMIVSNPPYIAEDERGEMDEDVLEFEPHSALFAGADGLDVIRRLVPASVEALRPGGHLLCEIGHRQGEAVRALFEQAGLTEVVVLKDLGRRDRVVVGQRP